MVLGVKMFIVGQVGSAEPFTVVEVPAYPQVFEAISDVLHRRPFSDSAYCFAPPQRLT